MMTVLMTIICVKFLQLLVVMLYSKTLQEIFTLGA